MKHTQFPSNKHMAKSFLRILMLPTCLISAQFLCSYYRAHLKNPMLANSIYPDLAQELVFGFFLLAVGACFLDLLEHTST